MSDFLTTLLASQRAKVPAVQPRVPARFESAPPTPLSGEMGFSEENIARGAPPARPLPRAERIAPRLQPTPYRGSLVVPPTQKIQSGREFAASDSENQAATSPSIRAEENSDAAPNVEHILHDRAPQPSATPRATAPEDTAPPMSGIVAQPRMRITRQAPALVPAASEASPQSAQQAPVLPHPPTIRVTIGRILVRAMQAPSPREPRAPAPAPKLSLDEYLKARERGER